MRISKKNLYLQVQKLERNSFFHEAEMASKWSVDKLEKDLALLKKDLEYLKEQVSEFKKRLEEQ